MKLRSLYLHNFRQFEGDHHIEFPKSAERNVIVINGGNGSGKTTLLNALTWVLYEEHTPAFEKPDQLVNENALVTSGKNEPVEAWVALEFEHDGEIFTATRRTFVEHVGGGRGAPQGPPMLEVEVIGHDGEVRRPQNPDVAVESVLPIRLFRHFFFDGERIEQLSKANAEEEVGLAIMNLLGLEVLERAIRHLDGETRQNLSRQLKKHGGNAIAEVVEKGEALRKRRAEIKTKHDEARANAEAAEKLREEIEGKLRSLEGAKQLQEQMDDLEQRRRELKSDIKRIDRELAQEISRRAFITFTCPAVEKTSKFLRESQDAGKIPAEYQRTFIQGLLDRKKCICGEDLHNGSSHEENVAKMLGTGGQGDIEEVAVQTGAITKRFPDRSKEFLETVRTRQDLRAQAVETIEQLDEKIDNLDLKLSKKDSEDIRELNKAKNNHKQVAREQERLAGRLESQIKGVDKDIEENEKEQETAQTADAEGRLVQRRQAVLGEALTFFRALFDGRAEEVRRQLDEDVRKLYGEISFKDYWPELTSEFRLVLRKRLGDSEEVSDDVAKSTGENQILSLAFIGSIAHYARRLSQREQKGEALGFTGGIYPVVMDSPFGAIDENYRRDVAAKIPKLAEQVCIFVSKSQSSEEVMDGLAPHLGKAYVVEFQTPKKGQKPEEIRLGNKAYPYVSPSPDEREHVHIHEVL